MAVKDSGIRHRRRWSDWHLCAGCEQVWPCFVVLLHRSQRWSWTGRA